MTIFLGCGFAAKYREGGGNFSVPLQWMLGLRRLNLDAIWLEVLPGTDNVLADQSKIRNFQRQLRAHGLAGRSNKVTKIPNRFKYWNRLFHAGLWSLHREQHLGSNPTQADRIFFSHINKS